ncbi:TetR/AcrR family transcriptional regulator [Methylohalobius crimeensis]|uniref:TetR/AcrR family transcriptional regulator n=1 Tax=Methylohalobius crimeensis TaxID=244365 RepID=UPI0003B4ABF4|nr:TetR/AcrR family transcriptional regulator [Methylohalobius crimeensis]
MNREARKQLNREKLLDRGVQLLMENGYHATGIQGILASVNIPKGSFYNYFSSKEAFGAEVIRHYIEPFIAQLDDFLSRPDLDPLSALRSYFDTLIQESARNDFKGGCLLGNLMGEIGDTSDTCRRVLQEAVHCYRDKIRQGLVQAQARGQVRTDRSAEELADLMVDYWQGTLLRMKIERSVVPLHAFMRHIFEHTLPG